MIAVLDTSAILSGKFYFGMADQVVTSPSVIKEFSEGGHSWRLMQYSIDAGMKVIAPPESAIEKIREAAIDTGDMENLSEADVEVLALAFHLKNSKLFTDDYAMQNVASHAGIDYGGVLQEGIKKKFYWRYRCASCGKFVEAGIKECPVCGGKIKRVRWK
ncbi:MAG: hypothetical protein DRN17_01490 [Thermoplasmata archaeon]|nr:MAG: hypothetical protein DRN17_01490 [Thermoplasmata archaeon]